MAEQKLTIKQKKFADEYVKTGNATDAAIKAGYSEKYAHTNANKLLQNTTIKARIDAQMQKLEDDKIMKADEALKLITAIARGEETTTVETKDGFG
ncbi:MAG: terminase small subunit [Lactobacillus crispatus]|nr:terminase small subunit [Lactobacillus crispatus]